MDGRSVLSSPALRPSHRKRDARHRNRSAFSGHGKEAPEDDHEPCDDLQLVFWPLSGLYARYRRLVRWLVLDQGCECAGKSAESNQAQDAPLTVEIKAVPERNEYQESGWIVQLMALKNAENAKNLVKDLQKRGYQAHTKPENGFTRVIIGPDVSKSKLERQIIELEKITGSKGQLLKFKPLNP